MNLPDNVVNFFQHQGFVIVSTIDEKGDIHSSCKDIVEIDRSGKVYLLDVYRGETRNNLKRSTNITISAVDEHKFMGFSLKGKAVFPSEEEIDPRLLKAWDERITSRLTQRLLRNLREEKGHPRHPEALLPKPEYLIVMEVEDIIDLTPHHIRQGV